MQVEGAGLQFLWMPDTPLLAGRWRDVYGHLTCAAMTTRTLRLGPGVTNPLTRHPVTTASAILTLDETSSGRADLVVGTGYSSAYIIGHKAATMATMRRATALWRSIFAGENTQLGGLEITLPHTHPHLPIYLAATGPKMLEMAGAIADGVLIHVGASPGSVAWALERIAAGEQQAGRAPHTVRRIVVAHAMVDDNKARAIDHMRPCAAGYYRHGHARELLRLAGLPEPPEVTGTFPRPYPDLGHAVDWEEAQRASTFVSDAAVEAMVCVGSGAEIADRVRALEALGIDAIWWRDEASYRRPDALLRGLEKEVLPRLR
jgi:5,10-methylenetetrahydromethanopterin reductase